MDGKDAAAVANELDQQNQTMTPDDQGGKSNKPHDMAADDEGAQAAAFNGTYQSIN